MSAAKPYRRMRGIPDRDLVQVIVELQQTVNQHAIVMRQLNERLLKLEGSQLIVEEDYWSKKAAALADSLPPAEGFHGLRPPPLTPAQWDAIDAQHAANQAIRADED